MLKLANIRVLSDIGLKPGEALDHVGEVEIGDGAGYCAISIDLEALRLDVVHGLTKKCTLAEAMKYRIEGDPDEDDQLEA